MIELLAALLPILLVDVLNPVLFAILVFAAGSSRPVANATAILLGHTLAYFFAGIAISFGVEAIMDRLANPQRIDFMISAVVGVLLIVLVIPTKKNGPPSADEPEWELTPLKCFGFGAVLNFIGIPFALPYFGAVARIMVSDLSSSQALGALLAYNVGYMLPFLLVPGAVAVSGEAAKPMLEKINAWLVKAAELLMPWLFLALGLALVADAAAYFVRGQGLL
jgi:cytochrome c biogenesis protein CcdA